MFQKFDILSLLKSATKTLAATVHRFFVTICNSAIFVPFERNSEFNIL